MMRANRTIAALIFIGLLLPYLGGVARAQDATIAKKAFTISGSMGLPGVTFLGLPGHVVTDGNGVYSVEVPQSWTGTVVPVKVGYTFQPPRREYASIDGNRTGNDYTPKVILFTISGNLGLPGVAIQGLPGRWVTDAQGHYRAQVEYGWSGKVTPKQEGYTFEPPFRQHTRVLKDQENQDYVARAAMCTVSGNAGLPGVAMKGFPGEVMTDPAGRYNTQVPYGWAGRVTPKKPGYEFTPDSREYPPLRADRPNQDYTARILTFRISGNVGVDGVTLKGLPGDPVTNSQGSYSAEVQHGWSGRVTPEKEGCTFIPEYQKYSFVDKDLPNQNFKAVVRTFTVSGRVGTHAVGVPGSPGVAGVTLLGFPGEPVTDEDGRYAATVEYGWSGIVTPKKEGFNFEPASREYSKITVNQREQNFVGTVTMVTISDVIAFGDAPIQDIRITADPGGYTATTDARGRYSLQVPYGWSGRLSMTKPGFTFVPSSIPYADVTSDIDGTRTSGVWPPLPPRASSGLPQVMAQVAADDVLVIPTAEVVPERIAETTEDMRVMLHIFREKLSEPRMILGVLRDYGNFFGADRKVEAFYLQGTAAVFVIEVDFPYSFPTQRPQEGEATKEAVDPVWQRARERLYSPPESRAYGTRGQSGQTPEMTFEQFKDELLRSLKHAVNLRNLDPNELIILTIVAQNEEAGWPGQAVSGRTYPGSGERAADGVTGGVAGGSYGRGGGAYAGSRSYGVTGRGRAGTLPPETSVAPATTVLTMQVKKADVDAFGRGDLDFEQFQQKVKTFTY